MLKTTKVYKTCKLKKIYQIDCKFKFRIIKAENLPIKL